MAKQQTNTESYPDQLCKLYSFKEEKARYRKSYINWDKIDRANKKINPVRQKSFFLSSPANKLLSAVIGKLRQGERVLLNHKYISTFTIVERRQNVRIIKELEDILDITYHNSITHNGKKHRFSYEFGYKEEKLENTSSTGNSIGTFMSRQNDPLYIYNKNKDIEYIDLESNFLQNSQELQSDKNNTIQIAELPKEPVKPAKLKIRPANERKKPINVKRKARIYHFNQYDAPQDLKHHYPLTKEDSGKLQSLSGRDFSLNAMNEILLDMSKRRDNKFYSKAQFIAYFGKCLRFEMRDSVKTGNDNFHIKVNKTHEELKEITITQDMEQYFSQVEQNAITNRSDETQFKARIVNKFSRAVAYNFLKNLSFICKMDNVLELHLRNTLSLTPSEETRLLWEAQSIGGYSDIEKIKILI